jgi:molybdopterin biosynthesis enzyme MoaB
VPGLVEMMRAEAIRNGPAGALTRGVSGVAGGTLIVNLPGTASAVREQFPVLGPALVPAVRSMRRARGLEPGR